MSQIRNEVQNAKRSALSVFFGLGAFVGISFFLRLPFVFGMFGSLGAYILGMLLFAPKQKPISLDAVPGVTKEMFDNTIRNAKQQLVEIRRYTAFLPYGSAKKKAVRIAELTEDIIEDVKKDPRDFKPAREFFNYYLEATVNILKSYTDIKKQGGNTKEIEDIFNKVDETLEVIQESFEKQLKKLMENDIMDLDVELTVLKKTLEMQGLNEKDYH